MTTDASYSLDQMLPGVLHNALNGGRCRSCRRRTDDAIIGHDGFCPVPALTRAIARIAADRAALAQAQAERDAATARLNAASDLLDPDLVECVRKRGYFECDCAKSAVVPHCLHCLYPKWMHDVAAALAGPEGGPR